MTVLVSVAYWCPAKLIVQGDMGKPETIEFRVRYRRLKRKERAELVTALTKKEVGDKEFLDQVLCDWDLKDRTGQPVVYSQATREQLVEDVDGLESALVLPWFGSAPSPADAEKNSAAPSGTTSVPAAQAIEGEAQTTTSASAAAASASTLTG